MRQQDEFHDLHIAALPRLRTHAHALTRNHAAAEDLVQDTVVNVLAARDSFTLDTNFRAWIHRILYNRFISVIRKSHAVGNLDDVSEAHLGVGGAQEDQLILGELRGAIGDLPAEQRAALLMVTLQGMSYDEVAEAMGCATGTAKSRVFRARRQLHAALLGEVAVSNDVTLPDVVVTNRTKQLGSASTGAAS